MTCEQKPEGSKEVSVQKSGGKAPGVPQAHQTRCTTELLFLLPSRLLFLYFLSLNCAITSPTIQEKKLRFTTWPYSFRNWTTIHSPRPFDPISYPNISYWLLSSPIARIIVTALFRPTSFFLWILLISIVLTALLASNLSSSNPSLMLPNKVVCEMQNLSCHSPASTFRWFFIMDKPPLFTVARRV